MLIALLIWSCKKCPPCTDICVSFSTQLLLVPAEAVSLKRGAGYVKSENKENVFVRKALLGQHTEVTLVKSTVT